MVSELLTDRPLLKTLYYRIRFKIVFLLVQYYIKILLIATKLCFSEKNLKRHWISKWNNSTVYLALNRARQLQLHYQPNMHYLKPPEATRRRILNGMQFLNDVLFMRKSATQIFKVVKYFPITGRLPSPGIWSND